MGLEMASSNAKYLKPDGTPLKRVVIKIGTSTLVDEQQRLRIDFISALARQIDELQRNGVSVVVVSSGAIGLGLRKLGISERPDDVPTLQAAAAMGQIELTKAYDNSLAHFGINMAQVLLTRKETSGRESYLHARDAMERLLSLGIVPLVNENDAVDVDEILFGDNDTLATIVASMIDADLVVLLTDIDGFYSADPRTAEDAELLHKVGNLTGELVKAAGGSGSALGSGGMISKIEAARVMMAAGIPMVICKGSHPSIISDIVAGKPVGTLFDREGDARNANAKKLWIALGATPKGSVTVDDGAVKAMRFNGSSLLPVGVKAFEGVFEVGDPISIVGENGLLIGRGLAKLSSAQLAQVAGMNSASIAKNAEIAHLGDTVLIHRDEMIVF